MMNTHTEAVEAAVEAARAALTDADGPLLELVRTLAVQMDATGLEGPGTRLAGTYLTAVRTLMARTSTIKVVSPGGKLAVLRAEADKRRAGMRAVG